MRVIPILGAVTLGLAACDSGTQERPEVAASRAVMLPYVAVPAGAIPRGTADRAAALALPGPAVTPELIQRGQERFAAFCAPCHGADGRGDGVIVSRGFPTPPSYHEARLRDVPAQHIVGVITNGRGRMYPYAERIPPDDRWAIAHFIKSLQARGPRAIHGDKQ